MSVVFLPEDENPKLAGEMFYVDEHHVEAGDNDER